ncbi:hypothetical protein ACHAQK_002662 [Fusarium lateritium]
MSGECKEPRRCGYCLDPHLTRSCPKTKPPMCAICDKPHPSCELWQCEDPRALNAIASAKLWRGPAEWESRSSVPSLDLSKAFDNVSREKLSRKVDDILGPFAHKSPDLAKAIEVIKRLLISPRSEHPKTVRVAADVDESAKSPSTQFSLRIGIPTGTGLFSPSPAMKATGISNVSAKAPECITSSPASSSSAPSTPQKRSRNGQDALSDHTQHKRVCRETKIRSPEEDSWFSAKAPELIPSSPASSSSAPSTPQKRSRDDKDAFLDGTQHKRVRCETTIEPPEENSRFLAEASEFIPSSRASSPSTPQKRSRDNKDGFRDGTQHKRVRCETTLQSSGRDRLDYYGQDAPLFPEEDAQPSSGQDARLWSGQDAPGFPKQNAQPSPDKFPDAPCSLDVKKLSPPKPDGTLNNWIVVEKKMPQRPGSGSIPINIAFEEQVQDSITCKPH